jgi:TrmH family RNA methyltransferase
MIAGIYVVLVRTSFPGNIGSAARALANMGGDGLILVDPQCQVNEEAHLMAAGAQDWLAKIRSYQTWKDFYEAEGEGYRIALTRRAGKRRKLKTLSVTVRELKEQAPSAEAGRPLYLIFGPEAHGLSADDMAWAHRSASLPIPGEFKSMNLAQAVMLGLFLTQDALGATKAPAEKEKLKSKYFPDESIRRWLTAMGFSLQKRRMSAYLTLRRLLLQNWPSERELHVLEAILQQNIRKLEELNRIKGAAGRSAALLEEVPDQLS